MVDLSFFNISAQKEEIPLSQTHPNQTQNKVMVEDNPSTLYGYINSLRAEWAKERAEWAKETTKLIENLIKKNNKERDEERAEWAKERAEEKAQRKKLTKKNKEHSELINKLIKLLTENENISS